MKKYVLFFGLTVFAFAVAGATGMSVSHVQDVVAATRIALNTSADWFTRLHKTFGPKVVQLLAYAQKKGYTVTITSALRPGDNGFHGKGGAIDINLAKDGQVWGLRVGQTSKQAWEDTGLPAYARSIGLRWGGDFSTPDVVHFDIGATLPKDQL